MHFSTLFSGKKSLASKEPKPKPEKTTSSEEKESKLFNSGIRKLPDAIISILPFRSHGTKNLKPRTTPSIKKGLPSKHPPHRHHCAQPSPANSPPHTRRPTPHNRTRPARKASRTPSGTKLKIPSQKPNLHKCHLADERLITTYTRRQISTSNQYKLSHPSLRRSSRQSRAIFSAIVNNAANLRLQLRAARQELQKLQERQASEVEWLARVGAPREMLEEMRKRQNEVARKRREEQLGRIAAWVDTHRLDPGRVVGGMR